MIPQLGAPIGFMGFVPVSAAHLNSKPQPEGLSDWAGATLLCVWPLPSLVALFAAAPGHVT
jgi:hypothetical protein